MGRGTCHRGQTSLIVRDGVRSQVGIEVSNGEKVKSLGKRGFSLEYE